MRFCVEQSRPHPAVRLSGGRGLDFGGRRPYRRRVGARALQRAPPALVHDPAHPVVLLRRHPAGHVGVQLAGHHVADALDDVGNLPRLLQRTDVLAGEAVQVGIDNATGGVDPLPDREEAIQLLRAQRLGLGSLPGAPSLQPLELRLALLHPRDRLHHPEAGRDHPRRENDADGGHRHEDYKQWDYQLFQPTTSTRTRPVPGPIRPMARAAAFDTSMTRPLWLGKRSLIRTTMLRWVDSNVTFTRVPKMNVAWAAVRASWS